MESVAGAVSSKTSAEGRIFILKVVFVFLRPALGATTPRIPHRGIFYPSLVPPFSSEHALVAGDVVPFGVACKVFAVV